MLMARQTGMSWNQIRREIISMWKLVGAIHTAPPSGHTSQL